MTGATYTYDTTGIHIANQSGTVYSHLKDNHQNVIGTANSAGEASDVEYEYDAFGNLTSTANAVPDPFGYCGEYLDSESGLIYLRNRYYDSTTGRFITEDPVKDGLNWYAYCTGNPVMYVDPWGWITEKEQRMYERGELSQTAYDILMGLTDRWNMMTTVESKNEVHELTEKFRQYNYYAEDCTEEANRTLWENGQYMLSYLPESIKSIDDYENVVPMLLNWYNLVKKEGDWDYKENKANWMPASEMFIMYGELISLADFGNWNYGYTGTAGALGATALYTGAGWAAESKDEEPPFYGDSEVDHYFVTHGIEQAQSIKRNYCIYDQDVRFWLDIMSNAEEFILFLGGVLQ